jgi:UDP-N-acetylglucosamine acyltransferase
MIGMGSVVTKDVPPFAMVSGCPAKFMRLNARGVQRAGFDWSELVIQDGVLTSSNPAAQAIIDAFHRDRRESRKIMPLVSK